MRNISFSMTKDSFCDGSKNVTRRLGWKNLKPGTYLMAIEKGQGLKKGEHVKKLGEIIVVVVEQEPLIDIVNRPVRGITRSEVEREGFPAWKDTPEKFVKFFCLTNRKCTPKTMVNRIVFRRLS
jgi:hypothetical protein